MADVGEASSKPFFQRKWDGFRASWHERFPYTSFLAEQLPAWSDADVDEFIASDPVNGPTLKTTREAAKYAAAGGVIGAVSTAAISWKYSKSPHGALLSLGFGAVVGMTAGQEVAKHALQLYRLDTMAAQVKFLEWWQKKTA